MRLLKENIKIVHFSLLIGCLNFLFFHFPFFKFVFNNVDYKSLNGITIILCFIILMPVLQSLLLNSQPLLFEQMIQPSMQRIIDEMMKEPVDEPFKLFFLRVKTEELICRLLMELVKRDEKQLYDLNSQDVQIIYEVKARMLAHLERPPVINELALGANMSPTKLKRLFKQIFGNSIFNYYQTHRMQEAARLLKEEKLSVSEAGYQLGFTNLSHFSRVFYEHTGVKPKQYSRS